MFEISGGSVENLLLSRDINDQVGQHFECQSLILTLNNLISLLKNNPLIIHQL